MTRELVAEHHGSGPLGPRVSALRMGIKLVMNMMAGRFGVAQIVAVRADR